MQKLEYWKKKIKNVHFDYLPEFLENNGFKSFSYPGSGNFVYKHKKHRVIIKHAYLCGRKPVKDSIPSIILPIHNFDSRFKIVIQPLCNITKYIPIKKLVYLANKYPNRDVGDFNVGYYRNKLVMFDW